MFRESVATMTRQLNELKVKSLAIDVSDQALMTFESATGNVVISYAARLQELPLQPGWALYDAGSSSRSFFGLFGRRNIPVAVGCDPYEGCGAVVGN